MNWFLKVSADNSEKDINSRLKDFIKSNSYTIKMFEEAGIELSEMDRNLTFKVKELNGEFADATSKEIVINKKLIDNLEDNFHFIIHELNHWLNRRSEKKWYFNDLEEIQSFVLAIAWEIKIGLDFKTIYSKIFPILKGHFKNEKTAKVFFNCLFQKAQKYLKE